MSIYVAWHKDKWLSPALAAFLGEVRVAFAARREEA